MVFSVPGKTFLAGEYLAVKAGPALLFLSQPCFELHVSKGSGKAPQIHPESPAGKFMALHENYFCGFDLNFQDPYNGKGGFGASTAQFLSVYALWAQQETPAQDMQRLLDFRHLLETYYQVAWNGEGQRPSGADLIGQLKGSLTFFDKAEGLISVKTWPFSDIEFYLLHTGNKIATHEHLKTLPDFDESGLRSSFSAIRKSFDTANSDDFVEGVKSYAAALKDLGFTCDPTLNLLEKIRQIHGVKAAKGCGALGADVVLVVTEKNNSQDFIQFCQTEKIALISSSHKISAGLTVQGAL